MATIGYATLQIIPSVKGISGKVSSQVGGDLVKAGQKAGRDTGDAIADGIEAAKSKVDKATTTLAKAQDKVADAAGKVRAEEAKLQALRDKGVTDVGRLTAAEERVNKARRDQSAASRDLESASKGLAAAQDGVARATSQAGESAEKSSRSFSSLGDVAKGVGSKLVSVGKYAAMAGGAAGVGLLATSLTKGFARLNALDQAEAKLRGLGRSAGEITSIMDSVNKSVKGTAFGLDEAANSASVFSTIGVKSGADMDRAMKLLADTTAQAGSSFGEMTPIFQKIIAQGGLTTETFDQLNERATGVGEALSKHLGIPMDEVRDKAKSINFEDFATAMEKNIGGAAQKTGETFQGAWDNANAALGRIGAKLLTPVFKAAPPVLGAITDGLDKIGALVEPSLEKLGSALGGLFGGGDVFGEVTGGFRAMVAAFKDGGDDVTSSGFAGALERIGLIARSVFDGLKDAGAQIMPVLQTIGDFVRDYLSVGFEIAAGIVDSFIETGKNIWTALQGPLESIGNTIRETVLPVFQSIGEWARDQLPKLKSMFESVKTVFDALSPVVTKIAGLFAGALATAFKVIWAILKPVIAVLKPVIGFLLSVIGVIFNVVSSIIAGLAPVVTWIVDHLGAPLQAIFGGIGRIVSWLWTSIMLPAWNGIKAAINIFWGWFSGTVWPILQTIFAGIGRVANWLWKNIMLPVWDGIKGAVETAKNLIGTAIEGIKGFFQGVADKATEIKDWIVDKFTAVVDFFKGLPGKIGEFAGKIFEPIRESAKSVFNGIAKLWNNTVGRLSFKAPSWVPGIGGKGFEVPKIPLMASGGKVRGRGSGTSDSILAALSNGEFVVNARATAQWLPWLTKINGGNGDGKTGPIPAFATGGLVGGAPLAETPGEGGLKPMSVLVRRLIQKLWPEITDIGGYRPSDPFPDHPSGQALDIMISDVGLGDEVKAWLMDNKGVFELDYTIWQQKYEPASGGGNIMEDRGSPTQNHMDHIHALFGAIGNPPAADPDRVPEGIRWPAGSADPDLAATVEQPLSPETPDQETTTSTETPQRMKSFRELGSDVGGLVADGIVDFFGIPSWIADPASAIKVDDGSSVRTSGTSGATPEQAPADPAAPEQTAARDPDAKDYSGWIAKAAKDLKLPERAAVIGTATGLVESGDPMKMYANNAVPESLNYPHDAVGSDHDSIGIFQQRPGWGTVAQRMDAFESAKLFFAAMVKVAGWETKPEGDVAQAVQRSAFPGKYAEKVGRAQELVKKTGLYDRGGWLQPGGLAVNHLNKPEPVLHPDHWSAVVDQTDAVGELVGAGVGGRGDTNITVYGQTTGDIVAELRREQWRGAGGYGSRGR